MSLTVFQSKNFRLTAVLCLALAFVFAGVLAKLGFDWWTDENYSHGLLVPFVIALIVWLEFDVLQSAEKRPNRLLGGAGIALAFVMLLGGTLGAELFTQRVSLLVMLAAIIVYFLGLRFLRLLAVPFALIALAIPIPQIIFNKIAMPLQMYASQIAVWGIRLFDIPTVRKGNVFEILPQGATQVIALEVVEACSGIRSLMTLVTLALVLAYFTRTARNFELSLRNTDLWRMCLLMLSAIPIAVLTNAARVTATGVLTYYYGKQATEGMLHDALGWSVYVAALGLLFAINLILKRVIPSPPAIAETPRPSIPATLTNVWLLVAVLIAGGVFINWFQTRSEAEVVRRPLAELPEKLGDWRQKGDEMRFGAATESVLRVSDYTQRYYTSVDGRIANLYVGYYASQRTGVTYHSPQNCLPGAGWVMREPEIIEITTPSGKTFTANRYRIDNGTFDEIMIYWYQGRGRSEASEYRDKFNTILDSTLRRRSDGAMVRVMTSVNGDEKAATKAAIDLSARLAENLSPFVPE